MTDTQKRIRDHRLKSDIKSVLKYSIIIMAALIMLYPLIWIIGASFDGSSVPSFSFIPQDFSLIGWQAAFSAPGWGSAQGYSLLRALSNTLQYTIPYVLFGTMSCLITAYAITRMHFKGKKIIFALIIGTLLMPATIFRIPLYAFWTSPGIVNLWDGSRIAFQAYLPLWAGSLFAVNSFSIFMFIQFFRTIPRDLDEAAYMDGANKFQVLFYVLMPILKPIVMTVALLMFISQFNDFQGPLIYRGHVSTYPLPIVLQLLGLDSTNTYAHVFARSIVSVSVLILIFFGAQKYFVGNDADSAIKG